MFLVQCGPVITRSSFSKILITDRGVSFVSSQSDWCSAAVIALLFVIQCGVDVTRSIFPKILTKDTHRSPVRTRYGLSFGGSASDWYSASVPAMICAISCCTRPRYNGARMYHDILHRVMTALDRVWSNIHYRPVNGAYHCWFMFHKHCPTTIPHIEGFIIKRRFCDYIE